MTTRSVAILGGGVVGVTTGLLLNLHGYRTRIYTNFRPDNFNPNAAPRYRPSEVASLHAAASVIPHSVEVEGHRIDELTEISQEFFRRLAFTATCGVRYQTHYEVYEEPPEGDPSFRPEYADVVGEFEPFPTDGSGDDNAPRRSEGMPIYGWSFEAIFAEAPSYLTRLYELYEASGGYVTLTGSGPDDIMDLQGFLDIQAADVFVDCSGEKSRLLYPGQEADSDEFIRGYYVKIKTQEVPVNQAYKHFSYNYTPTREVYPTAGVRGDLYFYPRSDGWVLGGSRQKGRLVADGLDDNKKRKWRFEGEETVGPTVDINGVSVPEPIYALNRTLIKGISGIDIEHFERFAATGFRFLPPKGIRLERDWDLEGISGGRPVIHNYGHGGAGYTLSWGTAYKVTSLVNEATGFEPEFLDRSGSFGTTAVLSILVDLCQTLYDRREDGK